MRFPGSPTMLPRLLLSGLLATLAACATRLAPDAPTYRVGGASAQFTQGRSAEQAYAGAVSALGRVDALDAPLKVLHAPLPPYPRNVRAAGQTGSIKVRFTIGPDGVVTDPTILGAPPAVLAAITVDTVLRWRFAPITRSGQPASVQAQQEFVYAIE